MLKTLKRSARALFYVGGMALLVGFSAPALAMEPPEVVYAKQSCTYWYYDGWATYQDCFDHYYAQYRATCFMDPDLNICYF